ncbi:3-ketodihydrosphingosine reductase [Anaeramoeba flamelloides]|uniref:3-ketodihydrosphingosine reductase n=1 Tax=Anaeramoeba flamelloides TaxID=1746091 RepID=A0ABQ8YXQ9_9EUKA|nr:3-ketodihydrosphingosine reductase [Anaeramoeba flamelloides]
MLLLMSSCITCTFRSLLTPYIPQVSLLNDQQFSAMLLVVVSFFCLISSILFHIRMNPSIYKLEKQHVVILSPFSLFTKCFAYKAILNGGHVSLIGSDQSELISFKTFLKQHIPKPTNQKKKKSTTTTTTTNENSDLQRISAIQAEKRSRKALPQALQKAKRDHGDINCLICYCNCASEYEGFASLSETQLVETTRETLATLNSIRLCIQQNEKLEQILIVCKSNSFNSLLKGWLSNFNQELIKKKKKTRLHLLEEKNLNENQHLKSLDRILIKMKKGKLLIS